MTIPFKALIQHTISNTATIKCQQQQDDRLISLDDPATTVMTDLCRVTVFTTEPTASIDSANVKMIACGVRLLFVTDNQGGLLGLITSTDILGEKPVLYMQTHHMRHDEICVQDIMTPKERLDVLHLKDVEQASVGDIIETVKSLGRQHMLVVEHTSNGHGETLRGIFSATQINRHMGLHIEPSQRADTFADIKQAVLNA